VDNVTLKYAVLIWMAVFKCPNGCTRYFQ